MFKTSTYKKERLKGKTMEKKKVKKATKKEDNKILLLALIFLSLTLSTISLIRVSSFNNTKKDAAEATEDISYSVYVGLTDKNQKRQMIETEVAKEIIKVICVNNNVGYTIYETNGGYKKDGAIHTEKSLVLEMDRIDDETLYNVANDIKRRLNTSSVMIMKKTVEVFDY